MSSREETRASSRTGTDSRSATEVSRSSRSSRSSLVVLVSDVVWETVVWETVVSSLAPTNESSIDRSIDSGAETRGAARASAGSTPASRIISSSASSDGTLRLPRLASATRSSALRHQRLTWYTFSLTSSDTGTSTSDASSSLAAWRPGANGGGVATSHPSPPTPSHNTQLSASMHDAPRRSKRSEEEEAEALDVRSENFSKVLARPCFETRYAPYDQSSESRLARRVGVMAVAGGRPSSSQSCTSVPKASESAKMESCACLQFGS